jgi:hypothetical protein
MSNRKAKGSANKRALPKVQNPFSPHLFFFRSLFFLKKHALVLPVLYVILKVSEGRLAGTFSREKVELKSSRKTWRGCLFNLFFLFFFLCVFFFSFFFFF